MKTTLNNNAEILRLLLESSRPNFGKILDSVVKDGNVQGVLLLLQHGAPIDYQNSKGNKPIHVAVEYRHPQIVEILLENKADIESRGQYGRTPLHWAGYSGCLECAKILVDKGAELDSVDKARNTPLVHPARVGFDGFVELLLKKGADVNAAYSGKSSLHWAAEDGRLSTIKLLLKFGADLKLKTGDGATALSYATSNRHLDVVDFIKNQLKCSEG